MASPARRPAPKRGRRPPRRALLRRWLAVVVVAFVAYLYWQPLTSYLERRGEVAREAAAVAALKAENRSLERRLALQRSDAVLVREARRLAYVHPGERLFIVKGIPEWRRAHERRSSIARDGG
ncbi:MAG TPA: septum formation initiator family protein [Gaiellaceae bacterium]|nr:septum formation initiator family protein [Gaiellaceae bacterium]